MKNDDVFVLLVQSSLSFEGTGKMLKNCARYLCMCEVIAGDGLYNCSLFALFRLNF